MSVLKSFTDRLFVVPAALYCRSPMSTSMFTTASYSCDGTLKPSTAGKNSGDDKVLFNDCDVESKPFGTLYPMQRFDLIVVFLRYKTGDLLNMFPDQL